MGKKVIKLTESDLYDIVNTVLSEQKIYTDHDTIYDYKVVDNSWYAKKKEGGKWFSLKKYPKSISKLNQKYPDAISKSGKTPTKVAGDAGKSIGKAGEVAGKMASEKSVDKSSKIIFNNTEEGNSFRQFVNDRFPSVAKKYDLDPKGSHKNSYIMKVANVAMILNKDKYGFKKGEKAKLFDIWKNKDVKSNEKGFLDTAADYAKAGFNQMSSAFSNLLGGFTNDYKPTEGNFVIPFAFPEYEPKLEKGTSEWVGYIAKFLTGAEKEGTYGKLGHSGIATVSPNGDTNIFEFGRYAGSKEGYGITKSRKLGRIAKIEDGVLQDFETLCTKIKAKTQGDGPRLKMDCRLVPVIDVDSAIKKASESTSKPYQAFDMDSSDNDANCATYTIEIAKAAGVPLGSFCMPNPTSVIKAFNQYSLDSVVV